MPTIENIEDVEDIDDLDMDLAEFDPNLVTAVAPRGSTDDELIRQRRAKEEREQELKKENAEKLQEDAAADDKAAAEAAAARQAAMRRVQLPPHLRHLMPLAPLMSMPLPVVPQEVNDELGAALASMQTLYPCYFDKNRSVEEGRRAPLEKCVENPLASDVLKACLEFELPAVLDLENSHPQDYGNPGAVKVALKIKGQPLLNRYPSKRELMLRVGEWLQAHPTTLQSVKGVPAPPELTQGTYEPQEVPRVGGLKMNTIVPLHSEFTMKNPQTAGVYRLKVPNLDEQPKVPKQKRKVQRIRM